MPALERSVIALAAFAMIFMMAIAQPAFAVNPDEILDDPVLEERARDLSSQIRCMTCQNQSIDDSEADLARDLRIMVRERIVAGDSNEQVLDYLVDRFGEFVLLKPRFSVSNLFLWAAPVLALLAGLYLSISVLRRRQPVAETAASRELSREEHERITKILDERD